ncbi:MAG: gamma carbonic anhydrase family protein [Firmicutes bacterium]|nr:gamma carbonic anhydrase family protein [Bacillota bacterium]MDY4960146.1 gamma carbonic anhydrase family protein [Lentihominibacter sp.]
MNIHESVFVADGAIIRGRVTIGEDSSVWFNAVIRAEQDEIRIGSRTNIQDTAVVHVDPGYPAIIGDDCTIGHNAIIHGCTIGNNCIIGMGAIIMDGAVIGDNCIIGAGSLVSEHKEIPANTIAFGNPVKIRKNMTEENIAANLRSAAGYVKEAKEYAE